MKKILYMNLLYNNSGQRRMDENLIRSMSKSADVFVVCPKQWYSNVIENVEYIYYEPSTLNTKGRIADYIREINNVFKVKKIDRKYHFDCFFFASYETAVFLLTNYFLRDKQSRSFIVHNNNIDRFNAVSIKKWIFRKYASRVNHVVLEKFIGDYLESNMGINRNRIFDLPHPLNPNPIEDRLQKTYDCIGISNSNDENWIQEIIDKETKLGFLKENRCKVVLRSKHNKFDNGYLKVISGWLSDDEYNHYINKAKIIFLPFPGSFRYRMSGSVVDAFSNYTYVLGSKIPLFEYYEKKYDSICKVVKSSDEFLNSIVRIKDEKVDIDSFNDFINEHSDEKIQEYLDIIISSC